MISAKPEKQHFLALGRVGNFADAILLMDEAYRRRTADGGIYAPLDNSPWIVMFIAVGAGGMYRKMTIDENRLVPVVEGYARLREEGLEMMLSDDWDLLENYEWYYLTINDRESTIWSERESNAEEFEEIFGNWNERMWLIPLEINEANIQDIIWGN